MSKELDIQIGVLNSHPDVQIGVIKGRNNIGIDVGGSEQRPDMAKIEVRTTEEWGNCTQYIPQSGRIIVYSDKSVVDGKSVPGIKIADGLAYVVDLPFVGDDVVAEYVHLLEEHTNDNVSHVTDAERQSWNNKINCTMNEQEETLIINRN